MKKFGIITKTNSVHVSCISRSIKGPQSHMDILSALGITILPQRSSLRPLLCLRTHQATSKKCWRSLHKVVRLRDGSCRSNDFDQVWIHFRISFMKGGDGNRNWSRERAAFVSVSFKHLWLSSAHVLHERGCFSQFVFILCSISSLIKCSFVLCF